MAYLSDSFRNLLRIIGNTLASQALTKSSLTSSCPSAKEDPVVCPLFSSEAPAHWHVARGPENTRMSCVEDGLKWYSMEDE